MENVMRSQMMNGCRWMKAVNSTSSPVMIRAGATEMSIEPKIKRRTSFQDCIARHSKDSRDRMRRTKREKWRETDRREGIRRTTCSWRASCGPTWTGTRSSCALGWRPSDRPSSGTVAAVKSSPCQMEPGPLSKPKIR